MEEGWCGRSEASAAFKVAPVVATSSMMIRFRSLILAPSLTMKASFKFFNLSSRDNDVCGRVCLCR